jgi:diguanylate cyclase (GGDEF)-like protein
MSDNPRTLPAYMRMPDGLRFSGAVGISGEGALRFEPKQALSAIPPEGLPVHLVVAGLHGDDEAQLSIPGTVDRSGPREVQVQPDDPLPDALIETLDPDSVVWLPSAEEAKVLVERMHEKGLDELCRAMRRFIIDLGDHLFDLSTSSRYGISGQHAHYDALNQLKRSNESLLEQFRQRLEKSLEDPRKDKQGQTFADLENASARSLDLVALDEMDQKLAIDKIVSGLIDRHRIPLECLTIRSALLNDLEPRRARTPFHPAYIVQAFTDCLEEITDSGTVIQDTLTFFGSRYSPELDTLYPALNAIFIEAGVEPDLEEEIRENGSLLNPPEKRIVKSESRERSPQERDRGPAREHDGEPARDAAGRDDARDGDGSPPRRAGEAADVAGSERTRGDRGSQPEGGARSRHDAMYDAVLEALETQRGAGGRGAEGHGDESPGAEDADAPPADTPAAEAPGGAAAGTAAPALDRDAILAALLQMQAQAPSAASLADLPPLEDALAGDSGAALENDSAKRLSFIDNVYRTIDQNYDVSPEMAPSLARLRVPLARLSLQEPRFFSQPEHPAHRLLDKLSTLASADHTINRTLQNKVAAIVDTVARDYRDDSAVFDRAQGELDALLGQQDRVLERNVSRVISALEGQEKLIRAQRRVENMLAQHVPTDETPEALVRLLDGGWRSALVQLALREGEDSVAWREEVALLEKLLKDIDLSGTGELPERERREMQLRLRALQKRLNESNPGSVAHESALRGIDALLAGQAPVTTVPYRSPTEHLEPPQAQRVEQLPRLRRWLKRVSELEPGAVLRYSDKDGRRRRMRLVWVSDDRNRFAFVNERGQKIAELSAVQLARQLSRGAKPPSSVDEMSVLDKSMYGTLEEAQKTLSFARNRDSLTRLINAESLLYQLKRSVRHAQTRDVEHAFLLLDIDNFGLVNEVFDETSGDEVLVEFARLLAQLNDRRALTARIEEDAFGIILTYRSADEARAIADGIRADVAAGSLSVGGEEVTFTVSVGVAPITETSRSPEAVLEQARSALELAKSQGRNQVVVYDVDQQELLDYKRDRDASRQRLDEAMSTDRLILRAQPIVQSAVSGAEHARHHYEVLLSLRDDSGELQSPQEFIMSAERFGYVTLVDRWVVREVFTWVSSLMDRQKVIPELSINLSGTSVTDNDFLDYLLEQISEHGVGTSKLCFEITETGAIDNLPRAADFVRTLKNLGCKFSLDDFGTGLASHKYLKELPVDYVKIDGTFITDVHQNRTDFAMAKSINDLAHFLGQKTVAECVESLDIVPALRDIGIDYLQGWGIGMPRTLDEVTEELADLET